MAELIIIRANPNHGKTTTCGLVYESLLKLAEEQHVFNDKIVHANCLEFNSKKETLDFNTILTVKNKKVGIISAGDIACDTQQTITIFIELNVDIIICCARKRNTKHSTYRMILNNFSDNNNNNIALEIFTNYSQDEDAKNEVKKGIVTQIIEKVINIVAK